MDTEEQIINNVKNVLHVKNPNSNFYTSSQQQSTMSFLSLFSRNSSKKSLNSHRKSKTLLAEFTARDSFKSTHRSSKKSIHQKTEPSFKLDKQLSHLSNKNKLSTNKNYHRLDKNSFQQLENQISMSSKSTRSGGGGGRVGFINSDINLNYNSAGKALQSAEVDGKEALQMDRNLAVQAFALQQVYNKDEERKELEMARAFELDMMVTDSRLKRLSKSPSKLLESVSNRFLLSDESRQYHSELMDCKKNGLFHPNTHFRKTWDLLTLVLIMYTSLTTPFILAFYDFNPYYKVKTKSILNYIDVFIDIWFIIDIYLTFNTAYQLGSHDLLITKKKSVRLNYLKGFFIIDFLAVFPFEPIAALSQMGEDSNIEALATFSVLKMLKLSRMVRVIRIAKVTKMFLDLEEKYGIDIGIVKSYGTILSSLGYMLILIHFVACLQFISTNSWCYGYKPDEVNQVADGFSWVELGNIAHLEPKYQYRKFQKLTNI